MASFVIDSIKIEGFKAFTKAQTLQLGGKHLFLFGENGRGKSSILEAIRWCIWGGEQETLLRNTFYQEDCQVELGLKTSNSVWRLHRRMRPGSGRSDVMLYDANGTRQRFEDIFPSLPRITGDGTYVILAEQQARGRAYVDIARFDQVLYAYLGITEEQDIIKRIIPLIEEYREVKDNLGEEADKLRRSLQETLSTITNQLKELLNRPPWGTGLPPTFDETVHNIQELGKFIGLSESLPLKTPRIALQRLQSYIDEQLNIASDIAELTKAEGELNHLVETQAHLQRDLKFLQQNAESIRQFKERLNELLQGKDLEQLKQELAKLDSDIKNKALLARIYQDSFNYMKDTGLSQCPLCKTDSQDLCQKLGEMTSTAEDENKNLIQLHQETTSIIQEGEQLIDKTNSIVADNERLTTSIKNSEKEIRLLLNLADEVSVEDQIVEKHISVLKEKISSLRQKQQNREQWCNEQAGKIRGLQDEIRYHELRGKQEQLLHWIDDGFSSFNRSYAVFIDALDTLEEIKNALCEALRSVLTSRIPQLENLMTQVYQHLTAQRSFDLVKLTFSEDLEWPELQVKVASSKRKERLYDYEDVLNGQALTALRLVPYFVFTRFRKEETLPLELLMLDDPSQRFDSGHVGYLFEELKQAASSAQLLIATHQESQFRPILDTYFPSPERLIMRVTDFDPDEGPVIEIC
jgi:chromosome segregation ATPase